jgi:hypothetical protein
VRRTSSGNRIAEVRLTIYDVDYEASVAVVRNALGDADLQSAWTEEGALSSRKRSPTRSALHDGNGVAQRGRHIDRERHCGSGGFVEHPDNIGSINNVCQVMLTTTPSDRLLSLVKIVVAQRWPLPALRD